MKIVFTPDWFLTGDVMIDLFSLVILALFLSLAFKSYTLSKKKSVLYLGIGFLLIADAEFVTIITKLPLYYNTDITTQIGTAVLSSNIVNTVDVFYYVGFFLQRFLTLLGFYVMYRLHYENKLTKDFLMLLYFIFVTALLSHSIYYFYHLTALIFLASIIDNYEKTYRKNKSVNTKMLIVGFSILALSQVVFIFSKIASVYAIGQLVQLAGYITLLVLLIKIVKNGKEKKPSGDNPRHA